MRLFFVGENSFETTLFHEFNKIHIYKKYKD